MWCEDGVGCGVRVLWMWCEDSVGVVWERCDNGMDGVCGVGMV